MGTRGRTRRRLEEKRNKRTLESKKKKKLARIQKAQDVIDKKKEVEAQILAFRKAKMAELEANVRKEQEVSVKEKTEEIKSSQMAGIQTLPK